MKAVSNVEEYILEAPEEHRALLQKVREIILRTAPEETKESISYAMPTYRYNGNLIHFGLFSKHLGIYPGPETINHFSTELRPYKTSRGTVQFPLNQPLPEDILEKIIRYNLDPLKNRKAPQGYNSRWQEAHEIMQDILLGTELRKEFKWGTDIYTFEGKNVVAWGGFKEFFSLWFYNGVFLEDKEKVLIAASEGKTRALRQWRFTDAAQMDEKKIRAYILESIQTIKDGKFLSPEKSSPVAPDGLLKEHLDMDSVFHQAFAALTPGKRKDYIIYIQEAKQEKTKLSRIEKIKPMILSGKGLHDKYKR